MVRAEIITIGDEILYGQILDTNTQWISFELDKLGIKTIRKSSVGDSDEEITAILNESKSRADVVFIIFFMLFVGEQRAARGAG